MLTRDRIEEIKQESAPNYLPGMTCTYPNAYTPMDSSDVSALCDMALAHLDDQDKIKKLEAERDAIGETMDTIIEVHKGDLKRLAGAEEIARAALSTVSSTCKCPWPCDSPDGFAECVSCIGNHALAYFADKGKGEGEDEG